MRHVAKTPMWDQPRGENVLDGGCPWYEVYECKDGRYMAVGALEPQFFEELVKGLRLNAGLNSRRHDRSTWPAIKGMLVSDSRQGQGPSGSKFSMARTHAAHPFSRKLNLSSKVMSRGLLLD